MNRKSKAHPRCVRCSRRIQGRRYRIRLLRALPQTGELPKAIGVMHLGCLTPNEAGSLTARNGWVPPSGRRP